MTHQTFLIATDFSETGTTVVRKGLQLARLYDASVHVIHVIDNPWYAKKQDSSTIQEHSWNTLCAAFPEISKSQFHCREGNIVTQILETAENISADLLIIGSSGEDFVFTELFIGSTTKNIVRNSHLPVLVVKNNIPLNPKRVLIPTDLSQNSKTTIYDTVRLLPNAQIYMVHFFDVPFKGRLKTYGFNEEDIIEYQMQIREQEEFSAHTFAKSLELSEEKARIFSRTGPLSPQLFLEISDDFKIDLVSIHTTGDFSFFALDLLEESKYDVLIFKY